ARRRVELPLLRVPAARGAGARRADRPRREDDRAALPDGGQPRRRGPRDAARAAAAAAAQGAWRLARDDRAGRQGVVAADGLARPRAGRAAEPAAAVLG